MKHRDINPFLQVFRNFLAGRKVVNRLRFYDELSPRTQPDPMLPDGPSDKLFANHYFKRKPWETVKPAEAIYLAENQYQMEGQEQVKEDRKQTEEDLNRLEAPKKDCKDVTTNSEQAFPINKKSSNSYTSRKAVPLPGKKYRWD